MSISSFSAAKSSSSLYLGMGVRGRTITPVHRTSQYSEHMGNIKIKKLTRPRRLEHTERPHQTQERVDPRALGSQLDDTAILSHIHHPSAKLVGKGLDSRQVQVLRNQRLACRHVLTCRRTVGVERAGGSGLSGRFKGASESEFALNLVVPLGLALGDEGRRVLRALVLDRVLERGVGDWARQLSFGKLGAEDGDFGKKQFTFDTGCLGVVQHGPDGDEVFELTTGLLDDAVLALEDDAHSGQVSDFGLADHERVWESGRRAGG